MYCDKIIIITIIITIKTKQNKRTNKQTPQSARRVRIMSESMRKVLQYLYWKYDCYFLAQFQERKKIILKKRLQHCCFPTKFAKVLTTPFFTEDL